MPVASMSRNTRLASVPEHDLLEKQRSIKRIANHRQSYSLPSVRLQSMCDTSSQFGHKGKARDHGDMSIFGEWVVNVNDMDSGLDIYGAKDRVILVFGDMPPATKSVIVASGNYSNTLFVSATNASLGIEPTLPSSDDTGQHLSQAQDDRSGLVSFRELPRESAFEISVNGVEAYRSVMRAAQKVASRWREKRKTLTPAARWAQQHQPDCPPVSATTKTTSGSRFQKTLLSTRRSTSFNLLSTLSRESTATPKSSERFDAIITYLPNEALTSEVGFQALLRQFYMATTAFNAMFTQSRSKEQAGPLLDGEEALQAWNPTLIYVLPTNSPANLPRTLQSYVMPLLSTTHQYEDLSQVFLLKERTLDRKMQRQEGRHPVTGLEIILSHSLRWERPSLPSQSSALNIYLEDFKHCRFQTSRSFETFDSRSANASYSSLSNTTTTTTDGEPQTPILSEDEDNVQVAAQLQVSSDNDLHDTRPPVGSITLTTELSTKSNKMVPFLRRMFSGERARRRL
ncbi:hypothetical protein NCC49_003832 [Naganishia albida]|nr:hypothetical protein NCC49_003832 [Naganishia albida]